MTTTTEGKRQFVPTVGNQFKLRTWSDYTSRGLFDHMWSNFETVSVDLEANTVHCERINGTNHTGEYHTFPLAAVNPPIGWEPTYTIYCKPEETDKVLGWFARGIRVKVDHAMDRLAGNAYMPADVDGAPSWGYGESDVVSAEDCPKVFNGVAYVHEEFRMPKDQWERKQYRKAMNAAGWKIESRNYGAHGYAWFRSKRVPVHQTDNPGVIGQLPKGVFKTPETSLDLLARLDAEYRPYDSDSERQAIKDGRPIPRWIVNRAEYHLNGNLQSAGNSTWMFDPEAKGGPVNRKA